jgi:hypothetical protein
MRVPRIRAGKAKSNKRRVLVYTAGIVLLLVFGAGIAHQQSRQRAPGPSDSFSRGVHTPEPRPDDDNYERLGMEKLAEMTALARHNEGCPDVPPEWSAAFIILLMASPPSEEQVEAKEREMLALRTKIGEAKWCLLHSVEMKEAYLVYEFVTHQ